MNDAPTGRQAACPRCGCTQPADAEYCVHCGLPMFPRPTGWGLSTWWPWSRWFLLHKVLHVEDTPHRIALGLAIGTFVALTPTFGAQMVLIVLLAWACRANKIVGVPVAWITNPVTMGPIYYFNYRIGELILGPGGKTLSHFQGLGTSVRHAWQLILEVFWRCWLGSLLVAAVAGVATYVVGYWLVVAHRARHSRRFPGSRYDAKGRWVRSHPPASSKGE
jgi:uncharacterized protein (DUF2062 family)